MISKDSVAEQVIAGLILVTITGFVVHAYDRMQEEKHARGRTSLSRISPYRKKR